MLAYAVFQDVHQTFVNLILLLRVLLICCKTKQQGAVDIVFWTVLKSTFLISIIPLLI
jgi:hypothetical protein